MAKLTTDTLDAALRVQNIQIEKSILSKVIKTIKLFEELSTVTIYDVVAMTTTSKSDLLDKLRHSIIQTKSFGVPREYIQTMVDTLLELNNK
jgi:hypothetical protein